MLPLESIVAFVFGVVILTPPLPETIAFAVSVPLFVTVPLPLSSAVHVQVPAVLLT